MRERFSNSASDSLVKKFDLHKTEIEKIVALFISLTGRLVKVVNKLENIDWNGVEEREDLDRKRNKLTEQLGEAKSLWNSIDKRTVMVAGYIEEFLSRMEDLH